VTEAIAARTPLSAAVRRLPVLRPPHGWTAAWVLLSVATAAALCSTDFLPFYDYYQWLFQGHVVAVLLFGADPGAGFVADGYSLSPVPVPNLAAPVLIGLFDTVLPTEAAGQVFIVVTVLGFACAFGLLVRTIQQRPTVVEFLGFPFATGFFLYKGYLSYAFGLAGMFLLVATLHRLTRQEEDVRRGALLGVSGLSVLLYLSHLLAWVMGGLAVVVYALVLARQGRRRTAIHLVAGLVPGVVLAGWYVLAEHGGSGITLYPSWREKAIALTETLQFFLRSDPFPPVLPLFWVNLAAALAFAGIVLSQLDVREIRAAVTTLPVLWLSSILALVALVLPISTINDLIKPDERFVVPALLLAIAALPYRVVRRRMTALGPVLAAAVVTLHLVEYVDVGQQIATVDAAIDAGVPDGTSVLHLTVPAPSGCAPGTGPVTGVPVLKWFAVDHALEGGPALVNIEETSLVHARRSMPADATVLDLDVADVSAAVLPTGYPYLEVVACPSDLAAVRQELAPRYAPVARGDAYTILART
jgi:hypothetical protein